jgi:signal transduction histidine kinase
VLVALLVVALPAMIVALVLSHRARRDAFVDAIYETTLDRMEDGGRERCEADPARFQLGAIGRRRGAGGGAGLRRRTRVYDDRFAPVADGERPLEPVLRDALSSGETAATSARGDDVTLAMRMPWDGRCAVVVVEARSVPAGLRRPRLWLDVGIVGAALLVAFVVVYFALGPPMRRLAALAAAVRAAKDGGATPPEQTFGRDEIGEVAQALAEAGERARAFVARLEARDRALTDYVDGTTHDLAIPLTVLQARLSDAETAQREGKPIDAALLASAMAECQYLAQLVANMGAMARIERSEGTIEKRPIDLGAIVERTVERFRPAARHHHVSLDFAVPDRPIGASGDDILVERLVGNLVHNAIRHHRGDGGHVAVVLAREGDRFAIRVLDDGRGVDDALVARLEAKSDVADPRRARSPGLGLRIVRSIAEAHGFTLAFARSDGGGLEVTVRGAIA